MTTLQKIDYLEQIKAGDDFLISSLVNQLKGCTQQALLKKGLTKMEVEEVIMDAIYIFYFKVVNDQFNDLGVDPIYYLRRVTYFRSLYYLKKRKGIIEEFDENTTLFDAISDRKKYRWDQILSAIEKLPDYKRNLISLTYFEGYSDREIIQNKLSPYCNVNSLKTQRYKAIQSLIALVED